jgi:hypothetical protein
MFTDAELDSALSQSASVGGGVMSARIVELSEFVSRRVASITQKRLEATGNVDDSAGQIAPDADGHRFFFWRGATGERYVHTVFGLLDCPELPRAIYILVKRDAQERRTVLHVGRADHEATSLNLAEVRFRGASLGANEVHVHFLVEGDRERRLVEFDLQTGLMGNRGSQNLHA